jgi:3' terminal RNA ribose 2'-O-methyltransferase Hen1
LSVAIGEVYGSALAGRSREREELVALPLPLTAHLSILPCRGGESLLRRLFEPLGYAVSASRHALDDRFPSWGASPYFTIDLATTVRLSDLLLHLTVLIPVLDDDKHYWVGEDELEKLLRRGKGWLETHPERDLIVERYLKRKRQAGSRSDRSPRRRRRSRSGSDGGGARSRRGSDRATDPTPHTRRLETVAGALRQSGANSQSSTSAAAKAN